MNFHLCLAGRAETAHGRKQKPFRGYGLAASDAKAELAMIDAQDRLLDFQDLFAFPLADCQLHSPVVLYGRLVHKIRQVTRFAFDPAGSPVRRDLQMLHLKQELPPDVCHQLLLDHLAPLSHDSLNWSDPSGSSWRSGIGL
jgi:hypothetical protein